MVTITHTPTKSASNTYTIIGDSIDEIIQECKKRIRAISLNFYQQEIKYDLEKFGTSAIDVHAGMGCYYNIQLKNN